MALGAERHAFVAGWGLVALLVWLAFARREHVTLRVQLARRWPAGLAAAAVTGALLVATVLRQPGARAPRGAGLLVDLAWLGGVYGIVDALMLSVLPVLALYGRRAADGPGAPAGRFGAAGAALVGAP